MTSVRESLKLAGQSASIKKLAHQRNAPFPLSLREFVGAPPPGRIRRKSISLEVLQRKSDEIFDNRTQQLFKIRLHNVGGGDHRHSTLTVSQDAGYQENGVEVYKVMANYPKDLGQLSSPISDYHFNDLNTSKILSPDFIPGDPLLLKILIYFEIKGEELILNNWPDVNFTGFKLELKFQFALDDRNNFLVTKKDWIKADVATNAIAGYRGVLERSIEGSMRDKIYKALYDIDKDTGKSPIQGLNGTLKRMMIGGEFQVTGVSSDNESLFIDYIVPPDQLEPFPENPQPPLDPGLLANIDHIVVLMMENRSFDHMLGYLSKEGDSGGTIHTNIDGLKGGEKNRYKAHDYPSFPLPDTRFIESPPHSHGPVESQIDGGKMDGFVAAFAEQYEAKGVNPSQIMGYHTGEHVPVYDALARQFLVCQRWFAAHPGPTFCNRFYTLTGRLNRNSFELFEPDNPHGADFRPVATRTIFDHLTESGVPWHYYENRYCFLRLFERYTFNNEAIIDFNDPVKGFEASAQAGTLPSVSFIDPNFVDEADDGDNDDGAPSDIRAGQHLIGRIVNAVMHGQKWNKTLLVITYDEHGGFFDHVNPLAYSQKAKPVSGIDHYGVRVPAIVVSPWVDPGAVSDVVFDHTSIAKTIAKRFMSVNPPDMGERVAEANDLSMVLRTSPRDDMPSVPIPPQPERNTAFARRAITEAEGDDFKTVMQALQAKYPVRRQ
ncbi:alkaline phosphatase family protein [Methylomonas montana]|uniref:phospholipase C n=1 Tax=Methylomonas montana TaxID=3058963 RepID=UPI00265987BE|nr:alkaline phosphatase family protein [Methylomonas montana]WKJ90064.1 alkaline phosphatase family protein [Methylomonas montana]